MNADKLVGQANGILGSILQLMVVFRTVRDAAKAANPELPEGEVPDDGQLIELLRLDSSRVVAHADALLAKYRAPGG